jgi:ABC-2 type transport system ATP-binding protein
MAPLVIDVAGLNKHFGNKHVVKDLSLQVRQGEIYGFLGPNGSGKTTSIRMLCGLLTPDSGRGTCLGLDVLRESAAIKRQVGYMTQKFSLWDDLSIGENLDFVARMFGMREAPKGRRSRPSMNSASSGRRQQLAGTLSGGWKQRLALAACLLHQPRLLLLDEPTAGVDPQARRDFWEEIHRLSVAGITVLVSTHYMDEAERCNRLAYIAYGNLLAAGTAGEVVANCRLHTWEVSGPGVHALAERLRQMPGAGQVASFGATLHVSGQDGERLQASLQTLTQQTTIQVTAVAPSLEDAFIHLMQHAEDPFAG